MPGIDDPFGAPIDDEFSIDLTGAISNDRYIAPGLHLGQLTELTKETSKAGNPMWVWTVTVARGEFAGKELPIYTALTPKALWKVSEVVEAFELGLPGEPLRFTKAQAIGKYCIMEVKDEINEGKTRSTLDKVHPLTVARELSQGIVQDGAAAAAPVTTRGSAPR